MSTQVAVASIVLAAGSGTRFGHSMNKVWLQLHGKHIISRSLENSRKSFSQVRSILVINPDDEEFAREALKKDGVLANTEIVHGGATRHESEYKALQYLKGDIEAGLIDLVLIHDGARPLATPQIFSAIADGAQTHGGAIPTIPLDPHEMDAARTETIARVQTPQGFRAQQLLQAYEKAAASGFIGTDTAACMEKFFPEVNTVAVPGDIFNIKITYPQDLAIAELLVPVQ